MTRHEENSGSMLQNVLAEYASDATEGGKKVKPIIFIVTHHFFYSTVTTYREKREPAGEQKYHFTPHSVTFTLQMELYRGDSYSKVWRLLLLRCSSFEQRMLETTFIVQCFKE